MRQSSVLLSLLGRNSKHYSPILSVNDIRRFAHLQGSPIRVSVDRPRPHTETSITVRPPRQGENLAYDLEVEEDRRWLGARQRARPRQDEPFARGSLAAGLFGKEGLPYWGGAYRTVEVAAVFVMVSLTLVVALPTAGAGAEFAATRIGASAATALGTGGVALGRYPQYLQAAEEGRLNVFSLNENLFRLLDKLGVGWTANQAFLDKAIETGQSFYLGSECLGQEGTIYEQELWYLRSKNIGPGLWELHRYIEPPLLRLDQQK